MAAKKKASKKKTSRKKTAKKTTTKKATQKKTTKKKAAKKKTTGKKSTRGTSKTSKKKASSKKNSSTMSKKITTKKKTAKKKAAKKKTTKKAAIKSAEKASSKKTAKKSTKTAAGESSAAKAQKKAAKKKRSTTKRKTAKKRRLEKEQKETAERLANTARVTVQIGPRKPGLDVAPGVVIHGPDTKNTKRKSAAHDETPRKLTKKEREKIREQLNLKREQLLHGIKRELADYRARSGNKSTDEADMAADAYDEDLSFEIASNSDKELEEIEHALDRLDEGSYGECEGCGELIGPSRLKILPYATTCKHCRDEKERNDRPNSQANWAFIGSAGNDDDE